MDLNSHITSILRNVENNPSENLESDIVEFKEYSSEKSLHNSKELAEEISALCNNIGGVIIVGVRDSCNMKNQNWEEQLIGFPKVDVYTTQERLSGKLRPKLKIEIIEITYKYKNYLVINVPEHNDTLVSTTSGKTCIREGKSSRPMEPYEITNAVKSLRDYDWSAEIIDKDILSLLDETAVDEAYANFSKRRGTQLSSVSDFFEAIGVTVDGKLTKSGILFLGKQKSIKTELGNYEYKFSKKTPSGDLPINEIWNDCLWNTIKKAKQIFAKINKNIEIIHQEKKYPLPLLDDIAFHEAFLNALVHRDYSIDGMIAIEFFEKEICITSPGNFYGGVNPDNIYSHEPRHRNKALASMLMLFNLVDRAGMGVLRMSLNSLKYGRDFPQFSERDSSIIVAMQAEYFKAEIFILSEDEKSKFGIPEYLILNSVYEAGYMPVSILRSRLKKIETNPWESLKKAVSNINSVEECVELYGDKKGVYVRVKKIWNDFFKVQNTYRVYSASENYVKIYDFLSQHQPASNANIKEYLGHKHPSTTSKFLRNIQFVKRSGRGNSSRWTLTNTTD
ncbi:MAG: hypothetical protein D3903_07450 [Candidatus Electrothrix sp. GM3_4]|nr:hypothetical protein [Candidatus Electrothrix sp. GM3_4]